MNLLKYQCSKHRPNNPNQTQAQSLLKWYPGLTKRISQTILRYYLNRGYFNLTQLEIAACIPPKTGTSNWQRSFLRLSKNITVERAYRLEGNALYQGIKRISFNEKHIQYRDIIIGLLKKLKYRKEVVPAYEDEVQEEHVMKIFDYINDNNRFSSRILNVRNPFERLVSAYNSKFSRIKTRPGKNKPVNSIFRQFSPYYNHINLKFNKEKVNLTSHYVPFRSFLEFIIAEDQHNSLRQMNIHWAPIYSWFRHFNIFVPLLYQLF